MVGSAAEGNIKLAGLNPLSGGIGEHRVSRAPLLRHVALHEPTATAGLKAATEIEPKIPRS